MKSQTTPQSPFPTPSNNNEDIAIIGMSCRFPGAKNVEEFWQNLRDGVESITFFDDQQLLNSGVDPELLQNPNYVKADGILSDIDLFDAFFFDFSAKEAAMLDPQHRLFLEEAWQAVENAGYDTQTYKGAVGVYAGVGINSYLLNNVYSNLDPGELTNFFQGMISNDKDFLSTRVSYALNLTGPSINVQTACSTSLVALHLACQSLLNGECDMALAGGATVRIPHKSGYLYQEGMAYSPDGHCRAFDAEAAGVVGGNGVGVVVLKRLEDALADGDSIQAVIKGSAINNDGSFKVGYTAPSIDGQAAAIAEAQAIAGVTPETVTYVEAHGTGTPLGDPIEIAALTQAFSNGSQEGGYCGIGSVKTNFGHLDTAAGVASLIKTVLALKHQEIPPSLHFEQPNPKIDFADSPFYVNTKLSPWSRNGTPRRAGVSSFGIGGTNAHVVLEEAPHQGPSGDSRPWQLLTLSAKTPTALETATTNLATYLQQHPQINLGDVAYTLQIGRREFAYRRTVVCRDLEDGITALQDPKRLLTSNLEQEEAPVAFMFTGLGSHYPNMGRELYKVEPVFRDTVDRCCELLKPFLNLDLKELLYPVNQEIPTTGKGLDLRKMLGRQSQAATPESEKLNQTYITQPAIFVIEYALAQLLLSWGIRPGAMIGYSIGEYVAATIAGVLSLEDAIALVAKRGQMIQELPSGSMLAVPLSPQEIQPLLGNNLSLSAINGTNLCVVAGDSTAVEELNAQLTAQGLACRPLQSSHAFHSSMMEPIAESFTALVKTVSLNSPQIPYISNVTGTWITPEQATDPNYWTKHLCQPVLFADGIEQLWQKYHPVLLEVGPGQTLSSLALQCLTGSVTEKFVLPSLRSDYEQQSDSAFLLNTVGKLWLAGVPIKWSQFSAQEQRQRLPLPTYPFERQSYWIEPLANPQRLSGRKADIADWFYVPVWKQAQLPEVEEEKQQKCWLVFVDKQGVGNQISQRLAGNQQEVIQVSIGEKFQQLREGEYTLNPHNSEDYNYLCQELQSQGKLPDHVVHLWTVEGEQGVSGVNSTGNREQLGNVNKSSLTGEGFNRSQHLGFYSLLFLTQALHKQGITQPLKIQVLSSGLQRVESTDLLSPEKATLLGLCKVIPQEYNYITCQSIDLALPETGTWQQEKLIDQLVTELKSASSDFSVAYRGQQRWLQTFDSLKLTKKSEPPARLQPKGVYIITGGLGLMGMALANYLAQSVPLKLVLVESSTFPPKEDWEFWLAEHGETNQESINIRNIQELENLEAEVLFIRADVTDEEQMQAVISKTQKQFGEINGVIHAAMTLEEAFLKPIAETDYTVCDKQFEPKIHGLYTLEKVLQGLELDFCLVVSSIGSVLGGVAVAAYCAANTFLDAFTQRQHQLGKMNWCSINWFHAEDANLFNGGDVEAFRQESQEAVQRILSHPLVPQIALWRSDLNVAIDELFNQKDVESKKANTTVYGHGHNWQEYVAPTNEIESRIANLYQEVLGIEQVGIHDNFFNLGGHSLLATQLISQLRQEFQTEIPLKSLFEAPCVEDLALVVEEILIGEIEELTEEEAEEAVNPQPQQAPRFANWGRYQLPNNLEIFCQTKAEADYFYEDIFAHKTYLKHGITLESGNCIFDVGANIGMFTMFVNQQCKNPTIYAFEPAPPLFEVLRLNTNLHEINAKLFNHGIANEPKTANFTFYPNSSGMSSFFADQEEEKQVLTAIMDNQLQSGMAGMEQIMEYREQLLEERLKSEAFTCELKTISQVISENNVEFIDLLKVDVQKSEWEVIQGIDNNHWHKIKQVVMEVHDEQGRLEKIVELLKVKGYKVVAEQEELYQGSNISNVYAVKL